MPALTSLTLRERVTIRNRLLRRYTMLFTLNQEGELVESLVCPSGVPMEVVFKLHNALKELGITTITTENVSMIRKYIEEKE
jgi:hypothetical protein